MFARLAEFIVHRRRWVLAAVGLATALSLLAAPGIRFDFTPQAVFDTGSGTLRFAEGFKRTFGYDDAALLVVLEATGAHDVLYREALEWQWRAARALRKVAQVESVESLPDLKLARQARWRPPWFSLAPVVTGVPVDEAAEERFRSALAEAPMVEGTMLGADRRLALLVVRTEPGAREVARTEAVVARVREVLSALPPPAGYRWRLTGLPALRVDIVQSLQADLGFLLPLAGVLFLVLLAGMFRRVSGTLLPLGAVGVGLAWTVGVLAAAGQSLNIVSNVLPVLLFVIGMANCVHVVSRQAEEWEWAPGDRLGATRRTIAHMGLACLLTSLTTAVGFASLLAARSAVLRGLGWHAVVGIGLLYVSTIGVLGALLPMLRPPRHCGAGSRVHPIARVVAAAGHGVARHPLRALAVSGAVLAAALWFARRVPVNSRVIETYPETHPAVRTMRLVEDRLGGILSVEVALDADRPGRFLEPAVYRRVAELASFAARQPGVLQVRSYVDFHRALYGRLAGGNAPPDDLPAQDSVGAERLRATGQALRLLGADLGYRSFMSADGRRARVMVRTRDLGTRRTLELMRRLEGEIGRLFPRGAGVQARLTGEAAIYAVCMTRFVRDLFYSLLGASVVIFAVIALLFRSLRLGVISMPPNLTPLLLTLGYMGLRGYQMNVTNVIVFAISLGIAVDNSIHFLARYREEVKLDGHVPEAVRRSFHGTGRAIVLTSVMIAGGLSVLLFSRFMPSRRFAELMAVTAAGALVGNLLLLPACLMLLRRRPRPAPRTRTAQRAAGGGRAEGRPPHTRRGP